MRVAIIGSGIAGLGCAYGLRHHEPTIFEQETRVGGHSHTVEVGGLSFDVGFMVFNHVNYPCLTALFKELEVETSACDMSFSVQDKKSGITWNGAGLNKIFAQRKNLFNPRFWSMLRELNWFNKNACSTLENGWGETNLDEYLSRFELSRDFAELYLIPMGSAIWSTPPDAMGDFDMGTLIRFFDNHGFLGLDTHHQWYTVVGGSRSYVQKLLARLPRGVLTGVPALSVDCDGTVHSARGAERFDAVVIATHADQALTLLSEPDTQQTRLLAPFAYQANDVTVHSDRSVMPREKLAWASWNYRLENGAASTHYWMNNLQHLPGKTDYFVSLNCATIEPSAVAMRLSMRHPLFNSRTRRAQEELSSLNVRGPIFFSGSYFANGFHEDAYRQSLAVVERLA